VFPSALKNGLRAKYIPDACPLFMSCTTDVSPSVNVTEMLTVEISLPGYGDLPIGERGGVSEPHWLPESC
jgi:hypothetical protein